MHACVRVYYVCIESCYVKGCWVNVGECITAHSLMLIVSCEHVKNKAPITI